MRRLIGLSFLVFAIAAAAGCKSGPAVLQGMITAAPTTNPDVNGRPSPIVVRVYELRSPDAFNGADFFALFEKEQEALGSDLVAREEYQLRPAESRPYRRQLQADTKFIAVAAAFRDLENSRWRQAVPLSGKPDATVTIGIDARAVTVAIK